MLTRSLPFRAGCCCAALLAADFACAEDWNLRKEDTDRDITVQVRPTDDGFGEFRAVTRVTSSLSAFVALFRDVEHMPEWVDSTARVESLARPTPGEDYSYTVIHLPWPLKDRDTVLHTRVSQNTETLAMTFDINGLPDYVPESKDYIRMPMVDATWTFTPIGSGRIEVEFRARANLGGMMARGPLKKMQNRLLWESPYKTLVALRDRITADRYQSQRFDLIQEPDESRG
jgi:START domain